MSRVIVDTYKAEAKYIVTSATFTVGMLALWGGWFLGKIDTGSLAGNVGIGLLAGVIVFWIAPIYYEKKAQKLIDEVTR